MPIKVTMNNGETVSIKGENEEGFWKKLDNMISTTPFFQANDSRYINLNKVLFIDIVGEESTEDDSQVEEDDDNGKETKSFYQI